MEYDQLVIYQVILPITTKYHNFEINKIINNRMLKFISLKKTQIIYLK
jgi:hypothetical protein